MDKTLALQESRFFLSEEKTIIAVAWRDKKAKKACFAVSTNTEAATEVQISRRGKEMDKPKLIHQYNQEMNGCDRADQMCSYYNQFDR